MQDSRRPHFTRRKINNRALSQDFHIIRRTKTTCSTKQMYNLTHVSPLFPIKHKIREVSPRPENPMGAAILSRHKTHTGCAARSAQQLLRVSIARLTHSHAISMRAWRDAFVYSGGRTVIRRDRFVCVLSEMVSFTTLSILPEHTGPV